MTAMGSQFGHDVPDTIENGYFVFTIMPTLHCPYNCKHCYLSLEQRRDTTTMTIEQMREVCRKVDAYWDQVQPPHRVVLVYNYGGEPTSTGPDYFESYVQMMAEEFPAAKGYEVKHVMLTSLLGVDLDVWAPLWHRYTGGYIQTSYDGSMRSNSYVRKWEAKVRDAVARGLRVATISVVNSDLLAQGAAQTLDILNDLGICETGWLPFGRWQKRWCLASPDRPSFVWRRGSQELTETLNLPARFLIEFPRKLGDLEVVVLRPNLGERAACLARDITKTLGPRRSENLP